MWRGVQGALKKVIGSAGGHGDGVGSCWQDVDWPLLLAFPPTLLRLWGQPAVAAKSCSTLCSLTAGRAACAAVMAALAVSATAEG
eukprot:455665-Pelagomonas_calceolata.AAC.4